ncbi:MAG: DmsC/YnfH family molybdoenzyme membrane anchor subunit, partial [Geminicoccaceae bacterium]|nr:DmsC/YnfH family molybdoenzyme membrane anchor subunit [Geminicoccaceae bacterium]
PVRSWHQPLTPWLYVVHALMSGALLLHLMLAPVSNGWQAAVWLALILLVAAGVADVAWRRQGAAGERPTIGDATGLGAGQRVRLVEPPHTQTNYLLDEMGYRVGRKHARRLRLIAQVLLAVAGLLTVVALGLGDLVASLAALLAVFAGLTATAVGRWLFFAEATHTVTLYYGSEGD